MSTAFDVIVVGGGAIGLTCAWRLAQTGRRVLLLERGPLGAEASSAAAGMLGAQLETVQPDAFYRLCLESRSLYPAFAEALLDATGIDPQLTHNGIYQLARTPAQALALQERMRWQRAEGARAEWLEGSEIAASEPTLAESVGALLLPDDGNVNAPLLVRALALAAEQTCTVVQGMPVTNITPESGGYTVTTLTGVYYGSSVVIAAGAWASALLRPLGMASQIEPVKGQLLSIRPRHGLRVRHTVFFDHNYLVPKRDGTIVVGATEDRNAGFNRDVTIDALTLLMSAVTNIAPALADAALERTWTGLRPGSPTGHPWVGEVPGYPGLHVAVGHYRNGILLSPVTGNMIVDAVSGVPWPTRWQDFGVPPMQPPIAP